MLWFDFNCDHPLQIDFEFKNLAKTSREPRACIQENARLLAPNRRASRAGANFSHIFWRGGCGGGQGRVAPSAWLCMVEVEVVRVRVNVRSPDGHDGFHGCAPPFSGGQNTRSAVMGVASLPEPSNVCFALASPLARVTVVSVGASVTPGEANSSTKCGSTS